MPKIGKKKPVNVREKEIEDILCFHLDILANVLNLEGGSISLIARQKALESGILDLLLTYKDALILVELKITEFRDEYPEQIKNYLRDLESLKQGNQLPNVPIKPIILVTAYQEMHKVKCQKEGIELLKYNVEDVLSQFYFRFAEYSEFIKLKPVDCGVWNLHLLNEPLRLAEQGLDRDDISERLRVSKSTVNHYFTLAKHFNFVIKLGKDYILTELGSKFIKAGSSDGSLNILSEEQIKLISDFIIDNPFYSPIVFGIYQVIEAIFFLSKTHCPVSRSELENFFKKLVGGENLWSDRTTFLMTGVYSNFAVELGLLGKIQNNYYLTLSGFKFILFLQLHRSIKLIESFANTK